MLSECNTPFANCQSIYLFAIGYNISVINISLLTTIIKIAMTLMDNDNHIHNDDNRIISS